MMITPTDLSPILLMSQDFPQEVTYFSSSDTYKTPKGQIRSSERMYYFFYWALLQATRKPNTLIQRWRRHRVRRKLYAITENFLLKVTQLGNPEKIFISQPRGYPDITLNENQVIVNVTLKVILEAFEVIEEKTKGVEKRKEKQVQLKLVFDWWKKPEGVEGINTEMVLYSEGEPSQTFEGVNLYKVFREEFILLISQIKDAADRKIKEAQQQIKMM